MSILAELSLFSRITLYSLLALFGLITCIVYWAQIGCVRGRPFENPDGGMASFWFLWANTMTTITSLRFERPKITFQWVVVFPFGAVVGLSYLAWTVVHFELLFGP